MKFLIPGQNFGIFASPTKGMGTFLFEMSMKWMFTFKNFRNIYWHGKTHSALGQGRLVSLSHVQTHVTDVKIFLTTLKSLCFRRMDGSYCRGTFGLEPTFSSASSMFCLASPKAQTFRTYSSGWPAGFFGSASSWWSVPSRRRWRRPRSLAGRPFPTRSTPKRLCRHLDS